VVRNAARILLVLLAVCLLLAVALMTDRSAPTSSRSPGRLAPVAPPVWDL
jgi:hypothetical protein